MCVYTWKVAPPEPQFRALQMPGYLFMRKELNQHVACSRYSIK